jgi:hypothetical protein
MLTLTLKLSSSVARTGASSSPARENEHAHERRQARAFRQEQTDERKPRPVTSGPILGKYGNAWSLAGPAREAEGAGWDDVLIWDSMTSGHEALPVVDLTERYDTTRSARPL